VSRGLSHRRGQGLDARRPPAIRLDQRPEEGPIQPIQPQAVDLLDGEGFLDYGDR